MQRPTLSVRIGQDVMDRLDQLAEQRGASRSDLAEQAVILGLEEMERVEHLFDNSAFRAVVGRLLGSEAVVRALAKFAGEEMPQEEIERVSEVIRKASERGRSRKGKGDSRVPGTATA